MIKRFLPYLLTVLCFIAACHVAQKAKQNMLSATDQGPMLPVFDKEGHRGCRGLMPENTIPAMLKAADLGVTTLEMDVVFTKDKQPILSHEPFLNHEITTITPASATPGHIKEEEEKSYNIYNMTYEEVRKFDVGLKPHPRFPQQQKMPAVKPLLSEVIDTVEHYQVSRGKPLLFYNIETKTMPGTDDLYHPPPAEFVDLLMKVIKSKGIEKRVIVQSFDIRTLQYLHQQYPDMKTAMLIEDFDKSGLDQHLKTLGFTPTIYSPAYQLVNEPLVARCHELHMKIIPWTVNDKKTIGKLKNMGVDGIISDYPNLFDE